MKDRVSKGVLEHSFHHALVQRWERLFSASDFEKTALLEFSCSSNKLKLKAIQVAPPKT